MSQKKATTEIATQKIKTKKNKEVLSVKLNDFDGQDGAIGEFYTVKCIIFIPDHSTTNHSLLEQEVTCLVDSLEFRKFQRKEKSIRWI